MIIHDISVSQYGITPNELSCGTEGSYGNEQIQFSFDNSWDGLTRTVSFYPPRTRAVRVIISSSGLVDIPHEATSQAGTFQFLINGYIDGRTINSVPGTYKVVNVPKAATTGSETPTPTEMQQVLTYMQTAVDVANSIEERANNGEFNGAPGQAGEIGPKGDTGADGKNFSVSGFYSTLAELQAAITNPTPGMAYGVGASPYDVYIYDGVTSAWVNNGKLKGEDGTSATISVGTTTTGEAGTNAEVTNSGTTSEAVLNFVIPRGAGGYDGADGRDIELQKTDTYIQWRYVGGSWSNLVALADITGADGDTGSDGRGISTITRTSGSGAAGTTDTYTIAFTDSTTATFSVYNGADGSGSGDMSKSIYDPNGKNTDAFNADNHVSGTTNKVFTATEKAKLSGIAENANNYSHPATHSADIITDGSTNKAYTAAEKTKLSGIAAGANNYTHPGYTTQSLGLYKITVDATGHVSAVTAATKADITALGITASDVSAVPVSGNVTMTGKLYAQANTDYTTYQVRNIALSTSAAVPTGNGSLLGVYS